MKKFKVKRKYVVGSALRAQAKKKVESDLGIQSVFDFNCFGDERRVRVFFLLTFVKNKFVLANGLTID